MIVFHLKKPYADFGSVVAQNTFTPVPKGQGAGNQLDSKPIASGPYKLAEYKPGASLKLVRNDKWDKKTDEGQAANPDVFQWTFGAEPGHHRRADDRQAGAPTSTRSRAPSRPPAWPGSPDPRLKQRTMTGLGGCTTYMGLNTTKKPLNDVRVKQAVNFAVNKQTVRDAVSGSTLADIATGTSSRRRWAKPGRLRPVSRPDHKGDLEGRPARC